jgi:hypothetical protein
MGLLNWNTETTLIFSESRPIAAKQRVVGRNRPNPVSYRPGDAAVFARGFRVSLARWDSWALLRADIQMLEYDRTSGEAAPPRR